ncbi:putative Kinase [Quillaja saponaria]|uniref:Kinase n=1 Tax=Quillaja saponaria TaxID=32244 RepID=A0AAD7PLB8_QUISA|nr:putative Kinase [Quillaja saponaria]
MFRRNTFHMICFARLFTILLLTLFLITQEACFAKKSRICNPSSCGRIHNISSPFRLKGDPKRCGYSRFELACEDDVLLLSLHSGKFNVQAINYNNYTIRLADPGVIRVQNHTGSNCFVSSIPDLYFLYQGNFSSEDMYQPFSSEHVPINQDIIFFKCSNPVRDDALYEADISCPNGHSKGHIYAIVGDFSISHLKFGCHVKLATMIFGNFSIQGDTYNKVSFIDIQRRMAYGFQLSWLNSICEYHCGSGVSCFINESTNSFQCDKYKFCAYFRSNYYTRCGTLEWIIEFIQVFSIPIEKGIVFSIGTKYVLGIACMIILSIFKWRRRHLSIYSTIEDFLQSNNNLMPIRYSYSQIKRMTKGFKEKIGEGGFGSVFKGKLRSGQLVAVKVLGKSKTNGEDFINEVATIGRIHHMNVVRLIGFCVEGSKRALVYEFMPNGSLDKYIFSKEGSNNTVDLSCERIYEISLGVAYGIAYLHQGCDMQILHFDIKPHNILLDENFSPKVSDFGLAKLYHVDDSIISLTAVRGTLGYMAPELFYKNIGGVSYKADVYSFGKLLMEMASRRKNLQSSVDGKGSSEENLSQIYFPFWIYNQLREGNDIELKEDATEEENNLTKKMIIVALWCIQLKPSDRPSMHRVVEMLEGEYQSLEMPPKPLMSPHEMSDADHGLDDSPYTSSVSYGEI